MDGTDSAPGDFLGGGGSDALDGGQDRDVLKGEDGNDEIYGRLGNDVLWGGDGETDYVHAGDDLVEDNLHGGAGSNDTCVGTYYDVFWGAGDCDHLEWF